MMSERISRQDKEERRTTEEEEDSLLPGPSFVSIVSLLGLIVYRRKKIII